MSFDSWHGIAQQLWYDYPGTLAVMVIVPVIIVGLIITVVRNK